MHIIAGQYRRQNLKTPEGLISRPTLSHIRESLFNILMPSIRDAVFVDAYAGVGCIGLEALSRGASFVTFIEANRAIAQILQENIRKFDAAGSHTLCAIGDALIEVKRYAIQKPADILFMDPPYEQAELDRWFQQPLTAECIAPDGQLVLQHQYQANVPDVWGSLKRVQTRTYGKTQLSFFKALNE